MKLVQADPAKISKEAAFLKGVEYFTEMVFFYLLVFCACGYEIHRNM